LGFSAIPPKKKKKGGVFTGGLSNKVWGGGGAGGGGGPGLFGVGPGGKKTPGGLGGSFLFQKKGVFLPPAMLQTKKSTNPWGKGGTAGGDRDLFGWGGSRVLRRVAPFFRLGLLGGWGGAGGGAPRDFRFFFVPGGPPKNGGARRGPPGFEGGQGPFGGGRGEFGGNFPRFCFPRSEFKKKGGMVPNPPPKGARVFFFF